MADFTQNMLMLDHKFDPQTRRHSLNGSTIALHCHHFTTLYTQLALDAKETGLLAETAEDSFLEELTNYFEDHCVNDISDRFNLACQYFGAIGLGKMNVVFAGLDSGMVELPHSHLDTGWIKKWGKFDKPINYIACGFICAVFSASFDKPARTFTASEVESIAMGAKKSAFTVVRK